MECAKVLLAFRAELNAVNGDGDTPLDVVAAANRAPVFLKTTLRQTSEDWTYMSTEYSEF